MTQMLSPPKTGLADRVTEHIYLPNVPWDAYVSLLEGIGDGATRLTYDRGQLEITVPSVHHEMINRFVGGMIDSALMRHRMDFEPSGSATWRQPDVSRGLEAGSAYHIQNAAAVIGKKELDLEIDPPPDLVIEVDLSSPSIDKLPIYSGMGVPEVWRVLDDGSCQMLKRSEHGTYARIEQSVAVPRMTPAIVSRFVVLRESIGHRRALEQFESEVLRGGQES
jgi:Uma2 family endonuclease